MGLFGFSPTYAPTKTTFHAPANEYELKRDREKHGRCANCAMQTHEIHGDLCGVRKTLVPITNDNVLSGRCLACNPLNSTGGREVHNDNFLMGGTTNKYMYEAPPPSAPTNNEISIVVPDSSSGQCSNCRGMQAHEVESKVSLEVQR
jgi:hypothetical protein